MKASKALKRLAKIETMLANVMKRYSAPDLGGVLKDAKAAVARAKEAVSSKLPKHAEPSG
jgi:hypothetical protein